MTDSILKQHDPFDDERPVLADLYHADHVARVTARAEQLAARAEIGAVIAVKLRSKVHGSSACTIHLRITAVRFSHVAFSARSAKAVFRVDGVSGANEHPRSLLLSKIPTL